MEREMVNLMDHILQTGGKMKLVFNSVSQELVCLWKIL